MKKLIAIFLSVIMIFSLSLTPVLAQGNEDDIQTNIENVIDTVGNLADDVIELLKAVHKLVGNVLSIFGKECPFCGKVHSVDFSDNDNENESNNKGTLSNFSADERFFFCNEDSTVIFTVENSDAKDQVKLIKNNSDFVGYMHDDGLNGDITANDGTYTYVLTDTVNSDYTVLVDYYAETTNEISDTLTLYYITDADIAASDELSQEIDEQINKIEQEFYRAKTDEEKIESAISVYNKVTSYVEKLEKEEKILYYVIEDNTITIRLLASTYVYIFDLSGNSKSKSTNNNGSITALQNDTNSRYKILSAQPYANELATDVIDNAAKSIENHYSNYTFSTNVDNSSVSISFLKKLNEYSVIIWDGHGGYTPDLHSFIGTGESSKGAESRYRRDMISEIPAIIELSGGTLGVTYRFFEKYFSESSFSDTIMYIGCCHSAEDNVLISTLINCGVSTVFGYKSSVYVGYSNDICKTLFETMIETNADGVPKSAIEAYNKAKETHGETDPTKQHWYNKVSEFLGLSKAEIPAELRLWGDWNYRFKYNEGTLSGKICKASDRTTAISNATIKINKNNSLLRSVKSNRTGNYSEKLVEGKYYVEILADGYIPFRSYANVKRNENTYMETFLLVEGNTNQIGTASGKITNSLTGAGIKDVNLTFKKDWNNSNENAETVATAKTNASGNYSINLNLGNYTVIAKKNGFVTGSFNIIVQCDTTANQNGSITPIISGDDYIITLTWGANPRDLDSHMVGSLSNGNRFHVYFSRKSQKDRNIEICNLDVDDTTSYGPENITLKASNANPYYYYIHRYAGSGTIASSGAKIAVHQGNTLVAEFNVPTDMSNGDYWNVFAIKDGKIIVKNTMTSSPDTAYAD